MKISVIGSGYVGIVTGMCFAELGNEVIFVDVDQKKIDLINSGTAPIYEVGLDELITKVQDNILATDDYHFALQNSEITFICVGTPSNEDGSLNTEYIESAAKEIGTVLHDKKAYHSVIMKSTVLPGTTENIVQKIIEEYSRKLAGTGFGIGSNPEFLKEGVALNDFKNPDRIVMGVTDTKTQNLLEDIYSSFSCEKYITTIKTAEMIKYASNAFLATKISFANEIGNICKSHGIDTKDVFTGVGFDKRINPSFFESGIGFGGSCFPKDVRALIAGARECGESARILESVVRVNEEQPKKMITLLKKHMSDLKGKRIGILGLAFKPDTDDIRESRAIPVIEGLLANGASVLAYDLLAEENMKKMFPVIEYVSSPDLLYSADALLITTAYHEFEDLDYHDKIVIDGRRTKKAEEEALVYEGVCW